MIKRYLYKVATDKAEGSVVPLVQFILWILSWIYRLITILRAILYKVRILKTHKLARPVICVGNITVGGVGKTPLVEYIAQHIKEKNIKPAILTRGYMEKALDSNDQTSDEAVMLQNALLDVPVLVGADRVKSAQTYLEHNEADVFILDDGFQHVRIHRDMDIVVIDATNPWGNGHLLPRGIMRESRNSLKRAHMFVLTKRDLAVGNLQSIRDQIRTINPEGFIVEANHKPVWFVDGRSEDSVSLELIKGERVCAISSIGAPESFELTLSKLDCDIAKHFIYIDHYQYTQQDIQKLIKTCFDQKITTVMTTEKDLVKLKHHLDTIPDEIRLLALKIQISITDEEDKFLERISSIL